MMAGVFFAVRAEILTTTLSRRVLQSVDCGIARFPVLVTAVTGAVPLSR